MRIVERRSPFPHWVLRGFWDERLLERALSEIPTDSDPRWARFANQDETKLGMSDPSGWGENIAEIMSVMMSEQFRYYLTKLTGIEGLVGRFEGGGIHLIKPGGKLGTHIDFNKHEGLYRRLNCLLYLNKDWTVEDGGALELRRWSDDPDPAVRVYPEMNTMVVFETSERSWHGHPVPLPGPRDRLSLACYFYTAQPPPEAVDAHSTIFAAR